MIEATSSIWPDGVFNGVEVLWLMVIGCLMALVSYARGKAAERQAALQGVPPLRGTPSQQRLESMGYAVDDLLHADAFAWPKE